MLLVAKTSSEKKKKKSTHIPSIHLGPLAYQLSALPPVWPPAGACCATEKLLLWKKRVKMRFMEGERERERERGGGGGKSVMQFVLRRIADMTNNWMRSDENSLKKSELLWKSVQPVARIGFLVRIFIVTLQNTKIILTYLCCGQPTAGRNEQSGFPMKEHASGRQP